MKAFPGSSVARLTFCCQLFGTDGYAADVPHYDPLLAN
jgi:hypothetical protein